MQYMDANKTYGEKSWRQLHKNAVMEEAPHKAAAVRPPNFHHKNYQS